jgi:hypothetical protein
VVSYQASSQAGTCGWLGLFVDKSAPYIEKPSTGMRRQHSPIAM